MSAARRFDSTEQLDHDIDVGADDQRGGVARDEFRGQSERGNGPEAAVGDAGQLEGGAELALEQRGVAAHQPDHALAHRAAAEQGYPYRFQRCTESRHVGGAL